ncbi:hypothetical protein J5N97_011992 [Dioscorea zingiberensis]|uniref:Uncharacterized protein n=1 Tax=Dioscorea zingiberensis TaxID=325984 RepID=A0A9D5HHE8_9LILI|nr:hypothetical protein J5N97_011992 [Dioscorea zingiberensis]
MLGVLTVQDDNSLRKLLNLVERKIELVNFGGVYSHKPSTALLLLLEIICKVPPQIVRVHPFPVSNSFLPPCWSPQLAEFVLSRWLPPGRLVLPFAIPFLGTVPLDINIDVKPSLPGHPSILETTRSSLSLRLQRSRVSTPPRPLSDPDDADNERPPADHAGDERPQETTALGSLLNCFYLGLIGVVRVGILLEAIASLSSAITFTEEVKRFISRYLTAILVALKGRCVKK